MRVYDGGSWVAASSAGGASLINYHYTATASQTAFTGADDNSNTLSYTVDNLIVTRNGVVLEDGTDYTATDGSTITLAVAAAAGDEINVVAFKSFTTADMVSATNGGTFQSNVTVNGTMTATAFSGDGSALTGITIPTLSSLGIANHDLVTVDGSGNVTVTGTVDGRDVATDGTKLDGIEALADVTDDTNVRAAGAVMTTGVSTLTDSAYFKGAPTHGFRFNNNSDAYNNFIIKENGDTYTRGNAGIGLTNPTYQLHLASTDPRIAIRNDNAGTWFTSVGWAVPNSNDYSIVQAGVAERLRIDSSGRVTMPAQPTFSGYNSNSNSATLTGYIGFTANINVGNHFSGSTFTCPVAGKYLVCFSSLSQYSTGTQFNIEKNNSSVYLMWNDSTSWHQMTGSAIVDCAANDTLRIYSSGRYVHGGSYTFLSIQLLS